MLETAFLLCNLGAGLVGLAGDELVKLIDEHQALGASVCKLHLDQHVGKTHGAHSDTAFGLLAVTVLLEEVRCVVDDVVKAVKLYT